MRVYVIRHGESENNLNGRRTGWYDTPLTPKGEQDAAKASRIIRGIPFDKIYSSDLSRAQKTAQIALPDCSYETTPLVREINVGTLANQPASVLNDAQRAYTLQHGFADYDGETREQFRDRIGKFMTQLESLQADNVAVFAHAGCLTTMLDFVMETALPRKRFYCNNCCVAVFEYDAGNWALHSWINL